MGNVWIDGFLRDEDTKELITTTDSTDADWQEGFLRAPDGSLVVSYE